MYIYVFIMQKNENAYSPRDKFTDHYVDWYKPVKACKVCEGVGVGGR